MEINPGLTATTIGLISAAVVTLVQFLKWSGYVPDRAGPLVAAVASAVGVALWAFSHPELLVRGAAFDLFAGWLVVLTSAAGVFGLIRAAGPAAVTTTSNPPTPGAMQDRPAPPPP